jgi:prepilin-type N-terminal cleavage/methylation domain-containing protein
LIFDINSSLVRLDMFLPTANIENMKYSAFTPLVFNFAWAARLHHPANFPTHAKRNRYEQRHRWTLDGIEFAASAITLRLRSGQVQPPRNNRKAFTLVELLVVIVVILSITAMMLPAIHNARNSAKAAACSANLGRLLSAMAAYESINESFPYGFDRRPCRGFRRQDGMVVVQLYRRIFRRFALQTERRKMSRKATGVPETAAKYPFRQLRREPVDLQGSRPDKNRIQRDAPLPKRRAKPEPDDALS